MEKGGQVVEKGGSARIERCTCYSARKPALRQAICGPTGAGIPYICAARTGPKVFHRMDCQRLAVSLTAWSHASSVTRLMSRSKKSARVCCDEF